MNYPKFIIFMKNYVYFNGKNFEMLMIIDISIPLDLNDSWM